MIHLHTHSMYSLRDSIIKPEDLIKRLKEIGQDTVAITDHGGSLGGVTIYKLLKEAGIKYIHGVEFYVCDDLAVKDKSSKYYHLIVLCKNETGRLNMNHLISLSERPENKYYKPRIDFNLLSQYDEGLVIMSACLAGEVAKKIMADDYEGAKQTALKYKERFGDDYYLEIQAHRDDDQVFVNREVLRLASELNIKSVVTCDAHYTYEEDKKYQNKYAFGGAYREEGESYIDCFVQSEQEVRDRLSYLDKDTQDSLINTTHEIADKCNVELPLSAPIMPRVDTPEDYNSNSEWLTSLCTQGFKSKLNIDYVNHKGFDNCELSQEKIDEYIQRFEYEKDSLERMGFVDYILLVYSYANIAERRGIARGSGGGSLICYLTNITDIDPIEHGLYFERFIDVGALKLLESGEITAKELKIPDIDLDFSGDNCRKVLQFLYDKYGEDKVCSIGKFGTAKTRTTIRDMCKVLEIPLSEADKIAKSFGDYEISDIDGFIEGDKIPQSAKEAVANVRKYPELFDYVRKLVELPKSFGLHACFVAGTKVNTDRGYVNIEDIKRGDLVLTDKGRYKPVCETMVNEASALTSLKFCGGFDFTSTPNHPIRVKKRIASKSGRKEFEDPKWVPANEIKKGDLVEVAINHQSVIPEYKGLPTSNPDFWWIVGRYMGDGWCEFPKGRNEKRLAICCSKVNMDYLEDIAEHLIGLFDFRYEESRTTYQIYIKSTTFFDFLQQFGRYAYGKHLNSTIFDLPTDLLKAFLDGYFSADGSRNKEGFMQFKTVSYDLAIGLEHCIAKVYNKVCVSNVIPAHIDVIEGRKVHSKEKYNLSFREWQVPKQRNLYDGESLWAFVKEAKTEEVEPTKVYNLTVEDDSTYTAENIVVHNCGKVISTTNLDDYLPSCYDKDGIRFLQGDMHDVEDVGLVKIDLLGLRTLDQIYDTLEMSGEDKSFLNLHEMVADPTVLDVFRNGDTLGIFQFSSPGMKQTIQKMDVQNLTDLSVANALFRPGSIGYIDEYCDRKSGKNPITYTHPDLEPILKSTYGIIVFQEQLIEIGRMAGIHNPDLLRKATGKKNPKLLAQVKPELEEKLKARGWTDEQFTKLWDDMLEFAKYSFNKAHSSAYAMLAYITAKQKAYYPAEFYAGLLNSYIGHSDFVKNDADEIIADARRHKVYLAPFNFRDDHRRCSVRNGRIVYAIPLIRDMSESVAEVLYRHSDTSAETFNELVRELMPDGIGASSMKVLIRLGFFSEYGNQNELLRIFEVCENFKFGDIKQMKGSKLEEDDFMRETVLKHGEVAKTKAGALSKTVKISDPIGILNDYETKIKSLGLRDLDLKVRASTQQEYLGFVSLTTGKESDRPKLRVKEIYPLNRKSDGKQFGYSVITQSLGSGIEARFTVFNNVYNKDPIQNGDFILCKSYRRENGYFTMTSYEHIYD